MSWLGTCRSLRGRTSPRDLHLGRGPSLPASLRLTSLSGHRRSATDARNGVHGSQRLAWVATDWNLPIAQR
eukprot:8021138-Alexandrium_andersonii.AAC.1